MKKLAIAFATGALFAAGLALSGMTRPTAVIGFLDVAGAWDPSLALVMIGAIGVHAVVLRLTRERARPLLSTRFQTVRTTRIDARLLVGAALFGVGWGLSGVCPGPALVSLGSATLGAIVMVAGVAAGAIVAGRFLRRDRAEAAPPASIPAQPATSK